MLTLAIIQCFPSLNDTQGCSPTVYGFTLISVGMMASADTGSCVLAHVDLLRRRQLDVSLRFGAEKAGKWLSEDHRCCMIGQPRVG